MLQLANCLRLHLAHALARDLEDATDFLKRVGVPVANSVAQLENLTLAIGQRLKHIVDALTKHVARRRIGWTCLTLVFDEIAEV